jgi:hypothetical protein
MRTYRMGATCIIVGLRSPAHLRLMYYWLRIGEATAVRGRTAGNRKAEKRCAHGHLPNKFTDEIQVASPAVGCVPVFG